MPGVSSGTRMKVRPLCRVDSGSLRNMPKSQWAKAPRLAQVFWPLITKWSPSLIAVAWMLAMSEPAFGSLQPCAQTSSEDAIFGRTRAFCSGVPTSMIVGPRRKMPFWLTRPGAPAR